MSFHNALVSGSTVISTPHVAQEYTACGGHFPKAEWCAWLQRYYALLYSHCQEVCLGEHAREDCTVTKRLVQELQLHIL